MGYGSSKRVGLRYDGEGEGVALTVLLGLFGEGDLAEEREAGEREEGKEEEATAHGEGREAE